MNFEANVAVDLQAKAPSAILSVGFYFMSRFEQSKRSNSPYQSMPRQQRRSRINKNHVERIYSFRCYIKIESLMSFGSVYPTRIEGSQRLFCDTFNEQQQTYCKRLQVSTKFCDYRVDTVSI